MGDKALAAKSRVDPWSRGSKPDRFSGPGSINQKAYDAERAAMKHPPPRNRSESPAKGRATSNPLGKPRASSVPRARPTAAATPAAPPPKTPPPSNVPRLNTTANNNNGGRSPKSAAGASPEGGSGNPLSAKGASSSAFATSAKGRFDVGPGSYLNSGSARSPGVGSYNPDDFAGGGALAKSTGAMQKKPTPGMAPSAKGRFDAGPGSLYVNAVADKKAAKKKKAPSLEDQAAEEWSRRLGLGAVAGAKAAPVLKEIDQARQAAEDKAAEAVAAMEAAEERSAEAVRKAEWMTDQAVGRVAAATERAEVAEGEAAEARRLHAEALDELAEARAQIAAMAAEQEAMKKELAKLPKRAQSPSGPVKVIDRRPVRLRGQVDADAETNAAKVEERRKKREEHWKKVEAERIAKEDRIREEQLAKTASSTQRSQRSARRGSEPPPPANALKALALVLPGITPAPTGAAKAGGPAPTAGSASRRGDKETDRAPPTRESPTKARPASGSPAERPRRSPFAPRTAAATPPSRSHEEAASSSPAAVDVSDAPAPPVVAQAATKAGVDAEVPQRSTRAPPPPPPSALLSLVGQGAALSQMPAAPAEPPPPPHQADVADEDDHARHIATSAAPRAFEDADSRPTGVSSQMASPDGSPSGGGGGSPLGSDASPVAPLALHGRTTTLQQQQQPAWTMSTRDFAEAEAEAERHAMEEARKEADAAADAAAARAQSNFEYDGLDDVETSSFRLEAEAAEAALKAVRAESAGHGASDHTAVAPPKGEHLFERQPMMAKQSSFSGSFKSLSESIGELPRDEFLSRLAKAEEVPPSPGGMKSRMGGGLFARVPTVAA